MTIKNTTFDDPCLNDTEFLKKLMREVVKSDRGVRAQKGRDHKSQTTQNVKNLLEQLKKYYVHTGIYDRDQVITDVFNKCSNSKPDKNFPAQPSKFLEGSSYQAWAKQRSKVLAHMAAKESQDTVELSAALKEVFAFDKPTLSDKSFAKKLINSIVGNDQGIRAGTTSKYAQEVYEGVEKVVRDIVAKHLNSDGHITDRDAVITESFDAWSNSLPNSRFAIRSSDFMRGSSFLAWAETRTKVAYETVKKRGGYVCPQFT